MKVNNDARATADPCKSSQGPLPVAPSQQANFHQLQGSGSGAVGGPCCTTMQNDYHSTTVSELAPVTGPSAPPPLELDDPKRNGAKNQFLLDVPSQGNHTDKRQLKHSHAALFVRPATTQVQLTARESVRRGKAAGCAIHTVALGTTQATRVFESLHESLSARVACVPETKNPFFASSRESPPLIDPRLYRHQLPPPLPTGSQARW